MTSRETLEEILDKDEDTHKSMLSTANTITQQSLAAEQDLDAIRLAMLEMITISEMVYQKVTIIQKQMEVVNDDNGSTQQHGT